MFEDIAITIFNKIDKGQIDFNNDVLLNIIDFKKNLIRAMELN